MSLAIRYRAPPTLSRFLDSQAFVRAVVGPFGSGKSSASVIEILRRAKEQAPQVDGIRRTRWAVVRNTYRELKDTTARTFADWVPEQLGRWVKEDFEFRMRFGDVEADVLFRALDRPQDVKKLLSLEVTGAYINEAREIPKAIIDGLQGRVGRYPAKKDGGCTWRGIWLDTNPWHTGHWGYKLFSREKPQGFELFEQPSGLSAQAENVENLDLGYYQRLMHGKDKEWIDVYVHGKYASSDRGSVYGDLLDALFRRGCIGDFEHPRDGIHAVFDLGISDSTSIWWMRPRGDGAEFVDHYEAHGRSMSHYFDVLDDREARRGFRYRHFWLPHDARARTLTTGESIQDLFMAACAAKRWGDAQVSIGPELSLMDGIQAGRWLLEREGTRFHSRCETGCDDVNGIEALREYRYEWDEDTKTYSRKPLHNWASHTADGFRVGAIVVKAQQRADRPPPKPAKPPPAYAVTLNDLFEANDG